jgi:hypothetical protein
MGRNRPVPEQKLVGGGDQDHRDDQADGAV